MNTLKKLQAYMGRRRALLPLSLLLSALSSLAGMLPFILIWFIIREVFTSGTYYSTELVNSYAWWAVASSLASVILYFTALSTSHLAAFRVETNMRREAMKKIINLPLGFFDNNTTGRIRKIIDDNTSITHSFLAHQMPDLAASVVMPFITIALIFTFDWLLGLVCLIPILLSVFLMGFMLGKKGKYFMTMYMNSLEEMNTEAVEYVRGIPVVKVFQQTVFSFKNFHKSIMKYKEMVFEYTRLWENPMSAYAIIINGFAFFLVPVSILIIGSTGDYTSTILNLLLFMLVTPILSISIMRSMYINQALGQATQAVNRMEEMTNTDPLPEAADPKPVKGYNIEFKNVSFRYPGTDNKALDNISFSNPEGKTIALVGASGGGKTTIARLIPRFWDACEGEVCIGGTDVKDLDQKELMNKVSFVFQNTRLFKTSILENIKYGKPEATSEDVEKIVELAQCRDIIDKLPDGLETKIGTEGTYLSGGEQQRIILARAILKDAPIIVLDEATAFADPENEHLIQQAFSKLTKGKTVVMIAHRLSSVINADNILVIDKGTIAEQGTHNELLYINGFYSSMWNEYQKSVKWTIGKEAYHA